MTDPRSRILDHSQLTKWQKMIRGAVSSVVPNHTMSKTGEEVVDDYISHYNCKPPPLFMIIISVAEVMYHIVIAYSTLSVYRIPVYQSFGVTDQRP